MIGVRGRFLGLICRGWHSSTVSAYPRSGGGSGRSSNPAIKKWEEYVAFDPDLASKSGSLDVSYVTNFGRIRLDDSNRVKCHGQLDDFENGGEDFENNEVKHEVRTPEVGFTRKDKATKVINDWFLESDPDPQFTAGPEILRISSKDPVQSGRNLFNEDYLEDLQKFKHSKSPENEFVPEESFNAIDQQFFPTLTHPKINDRKEDVANHNEDFKVAKEELNFVDQQFFSSITEQHDAKMDSKEVVPEKVHPNDLNFIDQQFFSGITSQQADHLNTITDTKKVEATSKEQSLGQLNIGIQSRLKRVATDEEKPDKLGTSNANSKDEVSRGLDGQDIKRKEKKKKVQNERSNGEMSALKYVQSLRQADRPTTFTDTKDVGAMSKDQLVGQMGVGIQSRLMKIATKEEKSDILGTKKLTSSNEDSGGSAPITHGRVDPKFLPPDLNKLTKIEIEEMLVSAIVHDDNDIVVINKPYGIAMFGEERITMETFAKSRGLIEIHRLDKTTTGALVYARTLEMHKQLTNLFRERRILKQYWTILNGTPDPETGVINIPIGQAKDDKGRYRMVLCPDYRKSQASGKKFHLTDKASEAITEYKTLVAKRNAALVQLKPASGLKHQIRAHLGFGLTTPVLGDHKYSNISEIGKPQRIHGDILIRLGIRRSRSRDLPIYLHSKKVIIPDVLESGKLLAVECGLPHFFVNAMKRLGLRPKHQIM